MNSFVNDFAHSNVSVGTSYLRVFGYDFLRDLPKITKLIRYFISFERIHGVSNLFVCTYNLHLYRYSTYYLKRICTKQNLFLDLFTKDFSIY